MRGPVLVTLTTSCSDAPTAAVAVADASTDAVSGTGAEHTPARSTMATTPTFTVVDP